MGINFWLWFIAQLSWRNMPTYLSFYNVVNKRKWDKKKNIMKGLKMYRGVQRSVIGKYI